MMSCSRNFIGIGAAVPTVGTSLKCPPIPYLWGLPHFCCPRTSENLILVTRAYANLFHRIYRLRKCIVIKPQGVVITRSTRATTHSTHHWPMYFPGKSTFQNLMLARLISARQVVVLCTSSDTCLFYRGQVYIDI